MIDENRKILQYQNLDSSTGLFKRRMAGLDIGVVHQEHSSFVLGPCAKKRVVFTLVTREGDRFIGTNDCLTPVDNCPREPGEGYAKCLTVCSQPAHAEVAALDLAGERARGAVGFLEGIDHVCDHCQSAIYAAGVMAVVFDGPESVA